MSSPKTTALAWIDQNRARISDWHSTIWDFHEPAWREYRSAAWYVERLRAKGFEVEEGSGGMPTAFCARWGDGGPVIGSYAEYDAVPGNSQERVAFEKPRAGLHRWAAGHTDPHSALGIGALAGILAAKAAMQELGIKGRLKFMGEPAEKVCGSKPVHAAKGYYDEMDAAISFHPAFGSLRANTTIWDTHCGSYWSCIYGFECLEPETWGHQSSERASAHTMARAPGAQDALCLMYTTTKYSKEAMLPHTGTWTLNEAILGAGQATADNLAPRFAQIQYSWRAPTLEMQEQIQAVLDRNAEHVAAMTHCRVTKTWVTKTRVGLPNHALAKLCYDNLAAVGPPVWEEEGLAFAREIQTNLGLEPMEQPILEGMRMLNAPEEAEAVLRQDLPAWQVNYTSDDYVDWTWHTPTVRLIIGRATLKSPKPGYHYPAWSWNALGGLPATIDPTIICAARCIATTALDLLTEPEALAAARAEFEERTGGGIGGNKWVAPLLPADFAPPIAAPWPEYVETPRGREWCLPTER
ncbi:MAG: amidohydrolase [Pseudomonadota bacterium]